MKSSDTDRPSARTKVKKPLGIDPGEEAERDMREMVINITWRKDPDLSAIAVGAEPMLAAGSDLSQIKRAIPEARQFVWKTHQEWCANMGLDPFGCRNWYQMRNQDEGKEARKFLSSREQLEQRRQVLEFINTGMIDPVLIKIMRAWTDRLIVQIQPRPQWPEFLYIPAWELPAGMLANPIYSTARGRLAKRWIELYPDVDTPEYLKTTPEQGPSGAVEEGWVRGLKDIGMYLGNLSTKAVRKRIEMKLIKVGYDGKSPVCRKSDLDAYLESCRKN